MSPAAKVIGVLQAEMDERIKEAFMYAKEAGLHYSFETSDDAHIKHPNTVEIIISFIIYKIIFITLMHT